MHKHFYSKRAFAKWYSDIGRMQQRVIAHLIVITSGTICKLHSKVKTRLTNADSRLVQPTIYPVFYKCLS